MATATVPYSNTSAANCCSSDSDFLVGQPIQVVEYSIDHVLDSRLAFSSELRIQLEKLWPFKQAGDRDEVLDDIASQNKERTGLEIEQDEDA